MKAIAKYLLIVGLALCAGVYSGIQYTSVKRESALKAIYGNLRQLDSAAEQFFMDHKEVDQVDYATLIKHYFRQDFYPLLGEDYSSIVFKRKALFISVHLPESMASVTLAK